MTPITYRRNAVTSGNEGVVGDVALQALIPFPGAFTPQQVRSRMVGPNLNGPPVAIWRRTTISNSNGDRAYCLYACERTGEAMWVPTGEYFVADRPRGAQPVGTVMDYLLSQRQQTAGPGGYGIHHAGRTLPGENGNIHRPRNNHASMVGSSRRNGHTRLHRLSHPARQEPAEAGSGSRRTVTRRDRRDRVREEHHPLPPPPPVTTGATSTSTSTVAGGNGQDSGHGVDTDEGSDAETTPPARASITIYNSNPSINGRADGHTTPQWPP